MPNQKFVVRYALPTLVIRCLKYWVGFRLDERGRDEAQAKRHTKEPAEEPRDDPTDTLAREKHVPRTKDPSGKGSDCNEIPPHIRKALFLLLPCHDVHNLSIATVSLPLS